MKLKFEVLESDGGACALAIDGVKYTGINCENWKITHTFLVPAPAIIRHLTNQWSGRGFPRGFWEKTKFLIKALFFNPW